MIDLMRRQQAAMGSRRRKAPFAAGLMASRRRRRQVKLVLIAAIAVVAVAYALFPIYWVFTASVDPLNTLSSQRFLPRSVSLRNYIELLDDPANPFGLWMANSLKISTAASAISVSLTTMAAYAFSRFRFRGRRALLKSLVLIQVFPNMLAMVAVFLTIYQIGTYIAPLGLNTHGGLLLAYLGGVLGGNVWLVKGFLDTIPRELDESALIDGASRGQVFLHVILPLTRPMLAVVAVLVFIGTYGEIILARILLQDTHLYTLAVGLWAFTDARFTENWGVFAAGALMAAVPVLVLFYALQELIVSGLTKGATKG